MADQNPTSSPARKASAGPQIVDLYPLGDALDMLLAHIRVVSQYGVKALVDLQEYGNSDGDNFLIGIEQRAADSKALLDRLIDEGARGRAAPEVKAGHISGRNAPGLHRIS